MKEVIYIAIVGAMVLAFMVAWARAYVIPKDKLMRSTQSCVEARTRQVHDRWKHQAEKVAWADCWNREAKHQGWMWSNQPFPRKQGSPP